MTIERKSDVAKMSKKERREKFNDWYDPRFRESQWRHGLIKSLNIYNKNTSLEDRWEGMPNCSNCKSVHGEMFKSEDSKWYCASCLSDLNKNAISTIDVIDKQEKFMKNAIRKLNGLELDPNLEAVPCDGCNKESSDLKLKMIDLGSGLESKYYCRKCLS